MFYVFPGIWSAAEMHHPSSSFQHTPVLAHQDIIEPTAATNLKENLQNVVGSSWKYLVVTILFISQEMKL
jgi:hypothetical protein